jgi:hypothetical protein
MNTRRKMTARFHELRQQGLDYADIERRLRLEFYREPPPVHDAALSAGIGEWARELRHLIAEILERSEA